MKRSKGNGFYFFMMILFAIILFLIARIDGPGPNVLKMSCVWPVKDDFEVISEYTEETKGLEIISNKEGCEVIATMDGTVIAAMSTVCEHTCNYLNDDCCDGLGNQF